MPELPEVETVARQLAARVRGRTVLGLRIYDSRLRSSPTPRLRGRRVCSVGRSGKRVLIELSPVRGNGRPLWLAVHLRMTGRLIWVDDGRAAGRSHLRARMTLDRGTVLFIDTRRFGTFGWYGTREEADPDGTEPLSTQFTLPRLARLLLGSKQNVKAWLLRQDRIAGLGNIYASEILHDAGISPWREAGSLERGEVRRLRVSTRRILRRAIRHCGTTFSDFQDARGVTGSYQQYLAVYGREGLPCPRCRKAIDRCVQQQRSTFHCPACQV